MVEICDEIVHIIKRVLAGITINDDTLALDVIREVGHGGSFLQQDHTIRYFRQEMFFPELFRRQTMDQWMEAGGKIAHEVADDRIQEILAEAGPVTLPPSADEALGRVSREATGESEKPREGRE